MKVLALAAALMAATCLQAKSVSRDEFKVLQAPTEDLGYFSGIKMGAFDTDTFLDSIKTDETHERYIDPTDDANKAVELQVARALKEVDLGGKGPLLTLTAKLISFRTGSSTARAGWGMMSDQGRGRLTGMGHLWYEFYLMDKKETVASFKIVVLMKANKMGAYRAVASYLKRCIEDQIDPLP